MKNKPTIIKKNVKHTFTQEEIAALNVEFRQAYANMKAVEADVAAEKSRLKAKMDEAQAQMDLKNATLQAGYEMRVKDCVVIFRPADKKKDFYLLPQFQSTGELIPDELPVITDDMTQDDFERDLIEAESAFENKAELTLWETGSDKGKLVVGALNCRWFAAVRGNVGALKIEERLDSEQMATKKRFDAISRASKRVNEWLKINLGKDTAKGFADTIYQVVDAEAEKAE